MATRRQTRRLARNPNRTLDYIEYGPDEEGNSLRQRLSRLADEWQTEDTLLMNAYRIEHFMEYQLLAALPLARSWAASHLIEAGSRPESWHGIERLAPRELRGLISDVGLHPEWGLRVVKHVSPRWVHDAIVQNNLPVTPSSFMHGFAWDRSVEESTRLLEYLPLLSPANEDSNHSITVWVACVRLDEELHPASDRIRASAKFLESLLLECAQKGYCLDAPDKASGLTAYGLIDQYGSEALRALFPPACGLK